MQINIDRSVQIFTNTVIATAVGVIILTVAKFQTYYATSDLYFNFFSTSCLLLIASLYSQLTKQIKPSIVLWVFIISGTLMVWL